MCYPSPGPRCAAHTKADYLSAFEDLKKASEDGDYEAYEEARKATESAKESWMRTPEGMRWLRENGQGDLAEVYRVERDASIAALKSRETQYSITPDSGAPLDPDVLRTTSDPSILARGVRQVIETDQPGLKMALYSNPNLSDSDVSEIVMKAPGSISSTLAMRPDLSEGTVTQIAESCPNLGWAVACNPIANEEALDIVQRTSDDAQARAYVAIHANASHEILSRSIDDEDPSVRMQVARNQNAGFDLRARLMQDRDAGVRNQLAASTRTEGTILKALAKDPNEQVRYSVASNPITPVPVLHEMVSQANETNLYVPAQAKLNLMERGVE